MPPSDISEFLPALPETLRALALRGAVRRFRKSELLIREGARDDTLFIILAGRVKVCSVADGDGESEREIIFGVFGPGDYLGEMCLDGGPRSASVIAIERGCCVMVTRQTLRGHIAANPDFAFELLSRVIRRARLATESARNMALLDVYGRVVHLLDSLAVPQADGTRLITERLTHTEISSRVGCSRAMVSRLMKDLTEGRHLVRQGRQWVLARKLPAHW